MCVYLYKELTVLPLLFVLGIQLQVAAHAELRLEEDGELFLRHRLRAPAVRALDPLQGLREGENTRGQRGPGNEWERDIFFKDKLINRIIDKSILMTAGNPDSTELFLNTELMLGFALLISSLKAYRRLFTDY